MRQQCGEHGCAKFGGLAWLTTFWDWDLNEPLIDVFEDDLVRLSIHDYCTREFYNYIAILLL